MSNGLRSEIIEHVDIMVGKGHGAESCVDLTHNLYVERVSLHNRKVKQAVAAGKETDALTVIDLDSLVRSRVYERQRCPRNSDDCGEEGRVAAGRDSRYGGYWGWERGEQRGKRFSSGAKAHCCGRAYVGALRKCARLKPAAT
jgi:hypothetical protein